MTGDERHWQCADGWVLVALARGGGRLRRFFYSADYINKAVPSYDETNGALRRLTGAGLVERTGDEFAVTRAGRQLLLKARARSLYDHMTRTREALSTSRLPPALPPWQVGQSLYDAELTQYHEDFQRDLEALDRGGWRLLDALDDGFWWLRRRLFRRRRP